MRTFLKSRSETESRRGRLPLFSHHRLEEKEPLSLSLSCLSCLLFPLDITYMLFAWLGLCENGARNEDFSIHLFFLKREELRAMATGTLDGRVCMKRKQVFLSHFLFFFLAPEGERAGWEAFSLSLLAGSRRAMMRDDDSMASSASSRSGVKATVDDRTRSPSTSQPSPSLLSLYSVVSGAGASVATKTILRE